MKDQIVDVTMRKTSAERRSETINNNGKLSKSASRVQASESAGITGLDCALLRWLGMRQTRARSEEKPGGTLTPPPDANKCYNLSDLKSLRICVRETLMPLIRNRSSRKKITAQVFSIIEGSVFAIYIMRGRYQISHSFSQFHNPSLTV